MCFWRVCWKWTQTGVIRHPWLNTPLYGRPVRTLLFLIKTLRTSNLPPEVPLCSLPIHDTLGSGTTFSWTEGWDLVETERHLIDVGTNVAAVTDCLRGVLCFL